MSYDEMAEMRDAELKSVYKNGYDEGFACGYNEAIGCKENLKALIAIMRATIKIYDAEK